MRRSCTGRAQVVPRSCTGRASKKAGRQSRQIKKKWAGVHRPDAGANQKIKVAPLFCTPAPSSPLAWSLSYPFPVHLISPGFQPAEPSDLPIFLLVYRNLDDEVLFLELNPMSAMLIDLLNDGKTGQQAAQQISYELQHPKPDVVIEGARELIHDWIKRSILIYPS